MLESLLESSILNLDQQCTLHITRLKLENLSNDQIKEISLKLLEQNLIQQNQIKFLINKLLKYEM